MSTDGLSKLSNAAKLLAEVRNATDAKSLMDKASAAEHYAKKAKLGQDAIDHAHVIKIDAQRLLGEFLKQAPKAPPGRPSKNGSKQEPISKPATLSESGITKKLSANSQALATIAEVEPEAFEKVRTGEMSVDRAVKQVIRRQAREATTWNGRPVPADAPPLNLDVSNDPGVRWMKAIKNIQGCLVCIPEKDTLAELPDKKRQYVTERFQSFAKQIKEAV